MTVLAITLCLTLLAIAGLHAYWGLGGVWPGEDAASCATKVGGFAGARGMAGPGPCFAVAGALCLAALFGLAAAGVIETPLPVPLVRSGTTVVALVFLGRGIAGFTPSWRRLTPEQPFATFDVRYYSPLSLVIGLGFATLAMQGTSL